MDHLRVKTKNVLPSDFVVFEYPFEKDSSAAERLQSYSSNDLISSHLSLANLLTDHLPLVPDLLTHFSTVSLKYSPAEHTPQRSNMSFMIPAHFKALEMHQSHLSLLTVDLFARIDFLSTLRYNRANAFPMDSFVHSFRTGISRSVRGGMLSYLVPPV